MEADINNKTVNIEKVLETACVHCNQVIDVSSQSTFEDIECPHCGNVMQVPGKLGNFTLLNIMGKGGMGSVYRARDEVLGRLVAIKVILPSLAEDKEFISTFKREAQAAAKVNHPHIAQIYAFGEENGQPYIVMELVTGRGLDQLIESGKVLDQGLIMQIGMDIAEGLLEADGMGLIHGDIKPENILLDEKMNGKLIDFGIASVGGVGSADGIWGTPYYIAPEKLRRETVDARSDIYCLGGTLYHALAGIPPFEGETPADVVKARLEAEPVPLREIRPDIHEDVERIIIRMLKTHPSQRYPTYASLLSDAYKVIALLKPEKNRSTKSKKIIIRKRGVVVGASNTDSIRQPVSIGKATTDPVVLSEEEKNNIKKIILKIFWILFTLVLIAGITVGAVFFKLNKDKDIDIRRTEYNLRKTITEIQNENIKIQMFVSNIVKQASVTVSIKDQIISIANVITEKSSKDLLDLFAPLPTGDKPADGAKDDAQGESNNVPVVAGATISNAVPAIASEPDVVNVVSKIEKINSPVIVLGRKVFVGINAIDTLIATAGKIGVESREYVEQSVNANSQKDIALVLSDMGGKQLQLVSIKNKITKILTKIDAVILEMETIRGNIEEQRADTAKARHELEKQKQQEAQQKLLLVAHETDVANDLDQLDGAHAAVKKAMNAYMYDDVIIDLKQQRSQLKTDEGKEAINIYIDRAIYMRDLKKFLIKQLNKSQFQWGWIDGSSPEDIIKATPKRIILKGKSVQWDAVSTKQLFHLIKHYVTDMNKSVKLVELGQQSMGVAVFCYEHEAYDASERYARKAVEMNSRLAKDSERLLVRPVEDELDADE